MSFALCNNIVLMRSELIDFMVQQVTFMAIFVLDRTCLHVYFLRESSDNKYINDKPFVMTAVN